MSEDNSPSNVDNQEQTEPNLQKPELEEAMLDLEKLEGPSDTLVPPANHGWLEQFEAFSLPAFQKLEEVAIQGLVEAESDLLLALAVKLVNLASTQDPKAIDKFDTLWAASH
jgi:hypothetical protein